MASYQEIIKQDGPQIESPLGSLYPCSKGCGSLDVDGWPDVGRTFWLERRRRKRTAAAAASAAAAAEWDISAFGTTPTEGRGDQSEKTWDKMLSYCISYPKKL